MTEPTLTTDDPEKLASLAKEGLNITEEDKEAFYKSFLSDTPYVEIISLFGGKLKLTFQTLSMRENEQVFKQIKKDETSGNSASDDAYFLTISTYRLGLSLIKINDEDFQRDISERTVALMNDADSTVAKVKSEVFKSWPTFKLISVIDAFRKFENRVNKLTAEVLSENFWVADKPGC